MDLVQMQKEEKTSQIDIHKKRDFTEENTEVIIKKENNYNEKIGISENIQIKTNFEENTNEKD